LRAWGRFWTLEFHPACNPPEHRDAVLVTDGGNVGLAFHHGGAFWDLDADACQAEEWPGIIAWAELPHPLGCVEGIMREHAGAPRCRLCGEPMMRWGWFGADFEPVEWWYCMPCDLNGRRPFIQVHPRRGMHAGLA